MGYCGSTIGQSGKRNRSEHNDEQRKCRRTGQKKKKRESNLDFILVPSWAHGTYHELRFMLLVSIDSALIFKNELIEFRNCIS